ncbi:alpha/beta-hydrolase [Macrolepiota fuliginosa MF-IS2]|uniref:Carboxylic ester hydrolase n=1 Tax=Macrolepiota fuliginosa MF-IS2 TaxID=1400762 RepID=A0A9P6C5F0_9AGAR|nr:alpha/beta-hydrolase [Macrolepiota fuliginosa MF-IS2]
MFSTSLIIYTTLLLNQYFPLSSSNIIVDVASTEEDRFIVDLGYAKYLGNHTTIWPNAVSYLGIPYAEPPLGEQRFRAPVSLNTSRITQEANGGVIDARFYSGGCIEGAFSPGVPIPGGSEDCLKVNVYTPAGVSPDAKLPLLVFIHGGAYVWGNPSNIPFEHWIQQSPNVIIVTIYYRLSAFGFLAIPEFITNPTLGDLNAGFLDQIKALKWVKRHIGKFGGDPNKVTIDGQSAGATSVEWHLIVGATGGEVLFRGAIAQSVYRAPVPNAEQQQPLFDAFVNRVGCGEGNVVEKMGCLRSASADVLAIAQDNVTTTLLGYNAFHVVVDKKVIVDYPVNLIRKGKFRKVPLIVGATSNETFLFGQDISADMKGAFPSLTDEGVSTLEQASLLMPSSSFASKALRYQTLTGDAGFRCTRPIMASAWDAAGTNTWTYRFNQADPNYQTPEVTHGADVYLMFRGSHIGDDGVTTFIPLNTTETAFSKELIAYWLSFVHTLNPNAHKLERAPVWPQFTADGRERVVLTAASNSVDADTVSGSGIEVEGEDEVRRCGIVAGLAEQLQD